MDRLTLHTGLFNDAEIIIEAADADVIDLRKELTETEWDDVLDQILEAELIISA